jgi:hypothetical protein
MAREVYDRDISPTLAAAEQWISTCLINDGSVFSSNSLWGSELLDGVYHAFVEHPDYGKDDFITKLKGQMKPASPSAQQLLAEMLWALLLFPSKMKARTKRQQIRDLWAMSGQKLPEEVILLGDNVLAGVGSGGPGFNNYRPDELTFLIGLSRDLKKREKGVRKQILTNYDAFIDWIESVPRKGSRQFRHMLRFFAFPDRVERISSNRDRRRILVGFNVAPADQMQTWSDRQLDDALLKLRADLQKGDPIGVLDFYRPETKERWSQAIKVQTPSGEVIVTVPTEEDEQEEVDPSPVEPKTPEARQSLKIQAKLAEMGAIMGFKVWVPKSDRARIRQLMSNQDHAQFPDTLPLSYDTATLDTIEQIDILWLKGRAIVRAFEVEHTTAVYSGLLRMADLLALQPNMDIHLHIVAPDERQEKVFREMLRPVFSLLDRGPLSNTCTFISYESIDALRGLEHLRHTSHSIIAEYEESPEP